MKINISERRVSTSQCDTLVRSISEAVTNTLNFNSEESYDIELHIDIHKSGDDEKSEEEVDPSDLETRLSHLECRFQELAVQNLSDELKKIMENSPRHSLFIFPDHITCTDAQKSNVFIDRNTCPEDSKF